MGSALDSTLDMHAAQWLCHVFAHRAIHKKIEAPISILEGILHFVWEVCLGMLHLQHDTVEIKDIPHSINSLQNKPTRLSDDGHALKLASFGAQH